MLVRLWALYNVYKCRIILKLVFYVSYTLKGGKKKSGLYSTKTSVCVCVKGRREMEWQLATGGEWGL